MFDRLPPAIHVAARLVARLRVLARREWITLQRNPVHQRVATAFLTAVSALAFGLSLHGMQSAEAQLGERTTVYVAVRNIAPGEPIDVTSVRTRHVPALALAPSTLRRPPTSLVARQHIAAGDMLSTTNVRTSPNVHLPRGWRLVMVVPVLPMPNLMPGSIVDIVVNAEVVAARVRVDDTIDRGRQVLVAVPPEHAAVVATLAVTGQVSLISN